ncbi:RidA family protein [Cupriavidus sp. USMAHM13]|uniref:RidA family protein n=1 Tax=Cupriavidus sp. USMAHM13 TaxID=1389192 RepID=UPI00214FAB73|nr:RidA family protein [Cupriavidus sp. USMAHM13]
MADVGPPGARGPAPFRRTAGGLVFISGQVGIRPDGTVPDSVEEQIELAFRRLGAVLVHEGLGFEDLVELVSYHVRIDEQLGAFREIKARCITREFPAWTILGVASLARPNLLVEIKAVAAAWVHGGRDADCIAR